MSGDEPNLDRSNERRPLAVVILAAGQGTRMKSRRSKVLHEIAGRPMLGHSLAAAEGLDAERLILVVGRDADEVRKAFAGRADFALQAEQRGTGHAVLQTADELRDFQGDILVMYGDTPLLRSESLEAMRSLKIGSGVGLVMLSALAPLPGRVVRDADGKVLRIVETTDATPEELAIEEGNTGVYLVDSDLLWEALDQVDDQNEQGEIYLTDVVAYAVSRRRGVEALLTEDPDESLGVNNRQELAEAARLIRARLAEYWMREGVTFVDPASTYIDVGVSIGPDTTIEPGCVIQGETSIGAGVRMRAGCVIEASRVDEGADLGPHLYLPPGSRVAAGQRITPHAESSEAERASAGAGRKKAGRKKSARVKKAAANSARDEKGQTAAKRSSVKSKQSAAGRVRTTRARKPRR